MPGGLRQKRPMFAMRWIWRMQIHVSGGKQQQEATGETPAEERGSNVRIRKN
jgi:hypothetical protein